MTRSRTRAGLLAGAATLSLTGIASLGLPAAAAVPAAAVFAATGTAQRYVVPDGVCAVTVEALGAQGGSGNMSTWVTPVAGGHTIFIFPDAGGLGAKVTSTLAVTPGASLQVNVGGMGDGGGTVDNDGEFTSPDAGKGGWNGGAAAGTDGNASVIGGGGGGASDVRLGGTSLADRVVVAGGGGGTGAGSGLSTPSPAGGAGGNPAVVGGDGSHQALDWFGDGLGDGKGYAAPISYGTGAGGGGGATATGGGAGGHAGTEGSAVGTVGHDGTLGVGGAGADSSLTASTQLGGFTGGGGGGGLYGGGGGGSDAAIDPGVQLPLTRLPRVAGAGGGGGSSLGDTTVPGVHAGEGQVTITPIAGDCHVPASVPASVPAASVPAVVPATAVVAKPTYTG